MQVCKWLVGEVPETGYNMVRTRYNKGVSLKHLSLVLFGLFYPPSSSRNRHVTLYVGLDVKKQSHSKADPPSVSSIHSSSDCGSNRPDLHSSSFSQLLCSLRLGQVTSHIRCTFLPTTPQKSESFYFLCFYLPELMLHCPTAQRCPGASTIFTLLFCFKTGS